MTKADIDSLTGHDGSNEIEDTDTAASGLSESPTMKNAVQLVNLPTIHGTTETVRLIDVKYADLKANANKWSGSPPTVYYCFDSSLDATRISAMEDAIAQAEQEIGGCITFTKQAACDDSDYYSLKISTQGDSSGCYVQGSSSGPA